MGGAPCKSQEIDRVIVVMGLDTDILPVRGVRLG